MDNEVDWKYFILKGSSINIKSTQRLYVVLYYHTFDDFHKKKLHTLHELCTKFAFLIHNCPSFSQNSSSAMVKHHIKTPVTKSFFSN